MTQLLEQTMNEVYKLPPEKQDIIAIMILNQLQKETKWNDVFVALADKLAQLAQTAKRNTIESSNRFPDLTEFRASIHLQGESMSETVIRQRREARY